MFDEEGLFRPASIKQNPVTKEIVVLDAGDYCLDFFTESGKFIRKVGNPGQGPGDLLKPLYMDIDMEGDIYVYESGNSRVSIFSKSGKFIRFVKTTGMLEPEFFVTKDKNIVFNKPSSDYYIREYSRDGEILKEIGEITKYNVPNSQFFKGAPDDLHNVLDVMYAEGFPFVDDNGNYIIFLKHLPVVKIYDKSGKLIKEQFIDKQLEIEEYYNPAKLEELLEQIYYYHIILKNDTFYFLKTKSDKDSKGRKIKTIMCLDKNFNLIKKIYLPVEIKYFSQKIIPRIEFLNDNENDILLTTPAECEILRFSSKENKE